MPPSRSERGFSLRKARLARSRRSFSKKKLRFFFENGAGTGK
jgi:hypothetical protein